MEVEAIDTLSFLDVSLTKEGPKLAMKVSRKRIHTCPYLQFKSNLPYHVKWGAVHSFIGRVKVMYQHQEDFNKGIKMLRHDLMLNEYPQEFVDSIMKSLRSNHPSSDTIYQGMAMFSCATSISEKFKRHGYRLHARGIFKTKHALHGALMKTGLPRDAQQKKQCVYSIPYDCGRCCIGERADL
jgi:hypothetical protein